MKKIYILFCIVSIALTSTANEGKVLSLSLYDLTATSLNKTYSDTQGNTIRVATNEPTFNEESTFSYTISVDNPLACIGENPNISPSGKKYSMATMVGHSTAKPVESPFILIEVPENNNILEIEVLAYATSGGTGLGAEAELICCFSPDSDPTNDDSFMINLDYENPLMQFKQTNCSSDNKRALPENTKFIKLITNSSYGWSGVTSYACKPQIHAINLYAKDTETNMGEESNNILNIQLLGRNLQLNEFSDIIVYDITGKVAAQFNNVDNAYLNSLKNGIYIIQATNRNGIRTVEKVILK